MSVILGLTLLVIGIVTLVISIQVLTHDKDSYAHNNKITGNIFNAISGSLDESKSCSPDEVSNGFTIDIRTDELVPCNQLSRESIS
jgi:hypothetical protein